METRVAVMSIIVEEAGTVETLNAILHDYGEYIIGRMGVPYRQRGINIISIALDAPQATISALSALALSEGICFPFAIPPHPIIAILSLAIFLFSFSNRKSKQVFILSTPDYTMETLIISVFPYNSFRMSARF